MPKYSRFMEHHVYFWLKEERDNEIDRAVFEQGMVALCKSANIESSHWGAPAETAERPVTDHSFSYAISLKFASLESHNHYQSGDAVHDAFVSAFKEWWARALVMDVA